MSRFKEIEEPLCEGLGGLRKIRFQPERNFFLKDCLRVGMTTKHERFEAGSGRSRVEQKS